MNPNKCKHEREISAAIERWEEKYRILKEEDEELDLADSWKMTAIQGIPCGEIQKSVEYREKEFTTYDELRSAVMKWAVNKKIEKERSIRGDPMDTSQVEKSEDAWSALSNAWETGNLGNWETSGEESKGEESEEIDYAQNGKGKGRGKGTGGKGNPGGKGGKGKGQINPMQMMMMMAIKGLKGGKSNWSQNQS